MLKSFLRTSIIQDHNYMKNFMESIRIQAFIVVLFPILLFGQDNNQNWVKTINYKIATTDAIPGPGPAEATVNLTYFDGLGRPVLQIANRQSDTSMDIVTQIEY